ncbi:transmembrane protein 232-like isoform X2 [Gigantopelta aegis]|uniref:transmembrane protein 232-like isoform X2 n=1 Tax=Gigantopelta aegis TaxID=1735272 RepID=UPI001B88B1B1|nr:transmembrane protein 232-like isoform X2 [Gigantopelta aegis]
MPITKIPIVHKFGIISHSQRLELQERLLKQSYLQSLKTRKAVVSNRNPLEVSEEFVLQFNSAKDLSEIEKLEEVARKMLERTKRRAGLKEFGVGHHVNLPLAWTEMAQLAQCKGKIQEDCLDVLIVSLDVSPVEKYHIPALFFLAETMLYWLRTEAVRQPYLRTSEIKLLTMGQLVFTRLFYHHMAGQLQGHSDFKNRLFTYLDGLQDCQEAYNPYPNALLSLRFIIEVGKIILADALIEPGEVKEGDRIPPQHNLKEISDATKELYEKRAHDDIQSSRSGAISSSVHDLSPTLWHSLDVWRCTNQLSGGFEDALRALSQCGLGLANESWVDGIIAIPILAEAAKSNIDALKVLQCLAQGIRVTEDAPHMSDGTDSDVISFSSKGEAGKKSECRTPFSSKQSLSDIYERSEDSTSPRKHVMLQQSDNTTESSTDLSWPPDSPDKKRYSDRSLQYFDEMRPHRPPLKQSHEFQLNFAQDGSPQDRNENREMSGGQEGQQTDKTSSRMSGKASGVDSMKSKSSVYNQGVPGTGNKAEAGTDLPSGRGSDASSVPTFTNMPSEMSGISGWHWEVAITYCDILCDVCLHGTSATIQKMALVGHNKDLMDPVRRLFTTVPLPSAGLIDLAFFHPLNEVKDGGPNDWSWRIRYGAIKSMVKICRCLADNKAQEGFRNGAWSILLKSHSTEKDDRVLEALKVGQVNTDLRCLVEHSMRDSPLTIGSRIAEGLAAVYLPPLPPPVEPVTPVKPRRRVFVQQDTTSTYTARHPMRTSLKDEIMLATALYEPPIDYHKRTMFDLRRIVEDQWRKELQQQLHEEEEEREEGLKEKQKSEELQQKEMATNREKKLKTAMQNLVNVSEQSFPEESIKRDQQSVTADKPVVSLNDTLES